MNPAITAAIIAAQEKSPTLVERLTTAGAVHSDRAIALSIEKAGQRVELDKSLRLGLVKRRADGALFLDPRAVAQRNARIGQGLLLWTVIATCFVASGAAILLFAR